MPSETRAPRGTPLTDSERQALAYAAAGYTNTQTANRLFLTTHTVKSHLKHAIRRLDAHSTTNAVALALVTGQLTSGDIPAGPEPSPPCPPKE